MSATPFQIALVHGTLSRLTRRPAQAGMAFRMHLARYAPGMENAYLGCPVTHLAEAMAVITRPAELRAVLTPLAQALRGIGIGPRDYVFLHAAFMDMASAYLDQDAELEEAYAEVIGRVLSTMLAAAYGPRRAGMPLAA